MASPPTPSRSSSLESETDHSLSISPGVAGMSDTDNYVQPETYFQPIQEHATLNSEYAAIISGSPSTIDLPDPIPTQVSPDGTELIVSNDASPQFLSLQTSSPDPSCLPLTHDITTSCDLTTENQWSELIGLGTLVSTPSPPCSLLSPTISVPKTSSPQIVPLTQDVDPFSCSPETQVQLNQGAELASSPCLDHMSKDSEVTSSLPYQESAKSELAGGSSEVSEHASSLDCYKSDMNILGMDTKQDNMNMNSISDEKLIPDGDVLETSIISNSSTFIDENNDSINPEVSVENSVISIGGRQPIEHWIHPSDLSSLEKPSISEKLLPITDVVENIQSESPDLKTLMLPTVPKAKTQCSADSMPVLYLQVTKAVQEEAQRETDTNLSQPPTVSSTSTRNKVRFSPSELTEHTARTVLGTIPNDGLLNCHRDPGSHEDPSKQLRNPPVVGDRITTDQKENSKKASPFPTKSRQPISPDIQQTQPTHWTSQAMSEANYHGYYRSVFPDYGYTDPPHTDKYSLHYFRAQHAKMDLKSCKPQMEFDAQCFEKNNQNGQPNLEQLEPFSAEHVNNSNQKTLRSRERSVKADQAKTTPYSSENYANYYKYGGWNPQGHYSNAYYQGYYYPYNYGYQSEFSKSNSQQYNTNPDHYDDWWRYDPRYDATFDRDYYSQYQQSYWDQGDRQSSHSGYSTRSMSSMNSHHSRFSWHSEQSWGYPNHMGGYPPYEVTVQSPALSKDHRQLQKQTSTEDFNASCSSESPSVPEQFSCPHCCARFGPAGQLVQVLPNLPSEGKPALVQIHSTEVMLQDSRDQIQLQTFPGPLIKDRTHKSEVLEFIRKKHQECLQSDTLADKETSCLIWEMMELVCKQNGKLVGTDISHLLLRNQRQPSSPKKASSDLIDFINEALSGTLGDTSTDAESVTEEDPFWTTSKDTEKAVQHFRELLILGQKKDALQTAVSKGLWGHAFMLASKMDNRAYSQVMSQFIDNLPESDPLRSFYQLMSGKIPSSAAHCGDKEWGDWRTHLAMVLSNHTRFKHLHKKTISRMGDALASAGRSDAASFCYMVVQLDVDTQSNKSGLFVLGANSSLPPPKYVTNEAIQRTEVFEYALSLGSDSAYLPEFQIFKFIYACRLAEAGLCAQAFQYCEVISKALLTSGLDQSLTLISQLIELSAKIRHFDQQMKDTTELDSSLEPEWMVNLRELQCQIIEKLNSPSIEKQQDTNLVPTLTTDSQAPQDIIENRAKAILPRSSQVLDAGCLESDNKAVSLSSISPIPQKSSYPTKLLVQDPVPAVETQGHSEPHHHNLLSTAGMLPENVGYLSVDQSREAKESTSTLATPLLAPPTVQQLFPVITESTIAQSQHTDLQSQYTDLQSQPANTVPSPKSTEFAMESSALPYMSSPSFVSMASESESVPRFVVDSNESYPLPSTMLPFPTSKSVPQLLASNKDAHELPSTTLSSTIILAKELEPVAQLTDSPMEPHVLPSTTLLSNLSLTKSESVPQLTVPLPFPTNIDQIKGQPDQKQQPVSQSNAFMSSPQMSSANNPLATEQSLYSDKVQPVPSVPTTMQVPQPSYPSVSTGMSPPTYLMGPQTVPLLTVPLPTSHNLPPHVAQTEFRPPQTMSLPEDPMPQCPNGQKPPSLPHSANPYAMGDKMLSSKQMHMLSKPLIPRLFVPQSPPPDPQPKKETGGGWFSWLFGKKKEVDLPVDTGKSLVWEDSLQRWVDPYEKKEKIQFGAGSKDFDVPHTKGLLDAKPVLSPGPKRGYMAPLNPVLMGNSPGTQHYASSDRSSTETQIVKPPNTLLTDPGKGTGHLRWTPNSQPVSYSQTTQNLSQNQKLLETAGNVPLYNPSHFCQDIL
uniref:Protein transport protein sec16 n=1 Tax=Astyanax mexicanus TaxID=7994 RepID=A0A8B9LGC7_ASTMX